MEPRWLSVARGYIGQREIKGKKHNPLILKWWKDIKQQFVDDETAWCSAFVGGVLKECGIKPANSGWARSYEKWGLPLDRPQAGAIVTFSRNGGGHVGFVVGQNEHSISVLGGNQRDAVNITKFAKNSKALKITSYRWPFGEPLPSRKLKNSEIDAPDGGPVTLLGQPDDPGVDDLPKSQGSLGRVLQWINAVGAAIGVVVASIADNWQTALVICGAALIVFCIIWFTTRKKCN
jgi:uncharacterized protein (TIGR02594 family)